MARPLKQGIDYFPYDADLDQDDKLGMIIGEFGIKGENLFTKLLCWIYKNEGYFTEWKEDVQLRFLRRYAYCGFSMSFIKEVVPKLIKWGLFDQAVFDSFQILSSTRIQETWLDATRKRTGRIYIPKYWLIKVNDALKPEETQEKTEVIDKRKESKVKEIKENDIVGAKAPRPPEKKLKVPLKTDPPDKKNAGAKKFTAPDLQEVKDFFLKVVGNSHKPGHWPADKCENEAGKFFDHYTANGWKQGRGKNIVNWEAAGRNWMRNEREGTFSPPVQFASKQKVEAEPQKPVLSKTESEVNYLFEKYSEEPEKLTIISVDPLHYDLIKRSGFISFSEDMVEEIKQLAQQYLKRQNIPIDETNLLKSMKRFGVLEFFKLHSNQGKETVFEYE